MSIMSVASNYWRHTLNATSWSLRHLHIALDTLVLYSVLGVSARDMDERTCGDCSEEVEISGANVPKRYRTSGRWQPQHVTKRMGSTSSVADSCHDGHMNA